MVITFRSTLVISSGRILLSSGIPTSTKHSSASANTGCDTGTNRGRSISRSTLDGRRNSTSGRLGDGILVQQRRIIGRSGSGIVGGTSGTWGTNSSVCTNVLVSASDITGWIGLSVKSVTWVGRLLLTKEPTTSLWLLFFPNLFTSIVVTISVMRSFLATIVVRVSWFFLPNKGAATTDTTKNSRENQQDRSSPQESELSGVHTGTSTVISESVPALDITGSQQRGSQEGEEQSNWNQSGSGNGQSRDRRNTEGNQSWDQRKDNEQQGNQQESPPSLGQVVDGSLLGL
ncbi:hypothetical protein WICPIJ_000405 [Wickerhamomyces pijperi]|uniref:Uncharacterized protein n=1 Tax=Wickerhamomyces pijperi TaxID=599730 RepID=A0A9P8QGN4_WICPI|nr:hypothetical protein WICPIJ_000405 [Wickerhamomyces pijperi]